MFHKKQKRKTEMVSLIECDLEELSRLDRADISDEDRLFHSTLLLRPSHREFFSWLPKTTHVSQEEFARLMNIDPSRISRLLARRILQPGMPWRVWFIQFDAYMKGVIAGRKGSGYF
jgi:hypothetical protein